MASSDDTFFDIKRLHAVFAAAALALLGVSIWLIAADHYRPWKAYQRTYRDQVEPWFTQARIAQLQSEADLRQAASGDDAGRRSLLESLQRTLAQQQPNLGKRLLRLPLIDAWGRPLEVQQLWLPNLTVDYHFRQVARFDRCTTCHLGIDKTGPGGTVDPALERPRRLALELATPRQPPEEAGRAGQGTGDDATLETVYGFLLAPRGIAHADRPTVGVVLPRSPAAEAGLIAGDVLLEINGRAVGSVGDVAAHLLREVSWGQKVSVQVERGLPQPFCAHPRPDLFVASHSPHPMQEFGCTICHAGQGSATDFTWASHWPNDPQQRADWRKQYGWSANPSWDYPMLPARLAEAACLRCHHQVSELEPNRRYPEPPAAKLLAGYHLVRQLGCFGCHEIRGVDDSGQSLGPDMRLEPSTAETAAGSHPGTLRKVGPSLAGVGQRLPKEYLVQWISNPGASRPSTRMPRQFGLHEHLDGQALADARRFEAVELRGIAEYLASTSAPSDSVKAEPQSSARATEPPLAQRGKRAFEIRGCLACHRHREFPEGQSDQGPDLSDLGSKYSTPQGSRWLVDWPRDPARYWPRTKMPNPMLEPVPFADGNGGAASSGETPRTVDPATDIAAWLLSRGDRKPQPLAPLVAADLDELLASYAAASEPNGAAAGRSSDPPVEARGLDTVTEKLREVGRRTIAKRGCYGCHEIPGFEDSQPIGPALSDWGRKSPSLLAFEQINQFVARSPEGVQPADATTSSAGETAAEAQSRRDSFRDALLSHRREGFLWQKLGAPRSFDYVKARGKKYGEHLQMGRFSLTDAQREAIATFVLGLVAEPPTERYVYQPDRRQQAIIGGRKVLDTFACAQCHTLELERWTIEYEPGKVSGPPPAAEYPSLVPHLPEADLAGSKSPDRRGRARAELRGTPRLDAKGQLQEGEDDDGNPVFGFTLWEPAAIDGRTWAVGGPDVLVGKSQIIAKQPPLGGQLARMLYPKVLAEARATGSSNADAEAWGWVPPSLVHEGRTVQPPWLYDYLRNPRVIRPAAVLRMPKFNLSGDEAASLTDYFAAAAGAEFPYVSRVPEAGLERAADATRQKRRDEAFRLMLDRTTYCGKCHILGDYQPPGENRTVLAPNLEEVSQRIRPEYLFRWLANPRSVLPYTAMPVNFPPGGEPMGQDLLPGSSRDQLDAVRDLLLNYDSYLKRRASVRRMAEEAGPAGTPTPAQKK